MRKNRSRFVDVETLSVKQLILEVIRRDGYETDNDGQVLIFTGLFEADDGSLTDGEGGETVVIPTSSPRKNRYHY